MNKFIIINKIIYIRISKIIISKFYRKIYLIRIIFIYLFK